MSSFPQASTVTNAYLEHFTAEDLRLLEPGITSSSRRDLVSSIAERLELMLASRELFERVFVTPRVEDPLLAASPFFVFAVAVHHAEAQLETTSYVSEWLGLGRRAPVFDVVQLREFMANPWHRYFLAELLASYTHVASGSVLVPTRRGFRRQRFSELDPVRLAALLDVVPEAERPGVLRRLGDLALFLTGVFPDYVARHGFGPIDEGRLLRSSGAKSAMPNTVIRNGRAAIPAVDRGAVGLLELLGRRWYRGAFESLPRPIADNLAVLGVLPERFDEARRVLGFVTEQFLFSHRDRWFGIAGT